MSVQADTSKVRRLYDRMAPRYDRVIGVWERMLFSGGRQWVCDRADGQVLEIALGTGRNLPCYREDVRLTAIELSPGMLAVARDRARSLGLEVDLRVGDAQALPFDDARFDTVVCTLALCTIPDDRQAVREAWRVLRPGGRLLLLEHVRSPIRVVRIGQELVEPLFLCLQRDHLLREPADAVERAGLAIEELERSKLGIVERLSARKPDPTAA
ncbi:MAG: class I SAM-dependent methyltransferase [Egibacteraceae bacterium]